MAVVMRSGAARRAGLVLRVRARPARSVPLVTVAVAAVRSRLAKAVPSARLRMLASRRVLTAAAVPVEAAPCPMVAVVRVGTVWLSATAAMLFAAVLARAVPLGIVGVGSALQSRWGLAAQLTSVLLLTAAVGPTGLTRRMMAGPPLLVEAVRAMAGPRTRASIRLPRPTGRAAPARPARRRVRFAMPLLPRLRPPIPVPSPVAVLATTAATSAGFKSVLST